MMLKLPFQTWELRLANPISVEKFQKLCAANSDWRMELDSDGSVWVTPSHRLLAGYAISKIGAALHSYEQQHNGQSFSPSLGFALPDGSVRSSDGSYISPEKFWVLTETDFNHFCRIVPDFVVEVRSKSDRLKKAKKKMVKTWIKNGVRLGWLIDVKNREIYIYRADGTIERLLGFDRTVTGETVVPNFSFDFSELLPPQVR